MQAQYTAVVQQHGEWWLGWIEEVPGVNSQARTREELLENLQDALEEALEMNRARTRAAVSGDYEEVKLSHGGGEKEVRETSRAGISEAETNASGPTLADKPGAFPGLVAFLRGVGSVMEVFPSPERFDAWRLTRDIPISEWPTAVRGVLRGLQEKEGSGEVPS